VGFNAVWFAKAASCALLALLVGFAGSLYLGAKLLGPVDETTKLETRSNQSIAAQTKPYNPREGANAQPHDDIESQSTSEVVHPPMAIHAAPTLQSHSAAKPDVIEPGTKQAISGNLPTGNQEELRLGQQERRRLRAERRKSLENANANLHRGPKPRPDTRDEPFFPFRF
jgi:hypothetical protein